MNDTLTPLEQQRLHELKHLVAVHALDVPPRYHRAGARRRYTRPAMALGTIAAAAAAAVFAFGSSGNHISAQLAGYSVHRAGDGVVTITLTDYTDAGQLSSELKADGIPAVVYLIPLGQICREPGATLVNLKPDYSMPGGLYSLPGFLPGGGWTMQLNPRHLKPGQAFVFGITPGGSQPASHTPRHAPRPGDRDRRLLHVRGKRAPGLLPVHPGDPHVLPAARRQLVRGGRDHRVRVELRTAPRRSRPGIPGTLIDRSARAGHRPARALCLGMPSCPRRRTR